MPEAVSNAELAAYLDVTPSTIGDLAAKGRVVRLARGKYDLRASVRAYVSHLRTSAAGRPGTKEDLTAEKTRLTKAQADRAEMERDEKAKVMVNVKLFEDRWAQEVAIFRQIMMGVPSSMAEALTGVSRHDTRVMEDVMRDALERCADEVFSLQRRQEAAAKEVKGPGRRSRGK